MLSFLAAQLEQGFGVSLCVVVCLSAVGVAAAYALLSRPAVRLAAGQGFVDGARGFLFAVLAASALLAVENYRATNYYRYGTYLNAYEFFHYYLGSKYQGELGSTRLYAAALIAVHSRPLWACAPVARRDCPLLFLKVVPWPSFPPPSSPASSVRAKPPCSSGC